MIILAMDSGVDTDPQKVAAHLKEDVRRVWELRAQGVIRAIYQRGENPFAVMLLGV